MNKKFVSVIIPTYNREDSLKKTLKSLLNQSYPCEKYEIIVVDDGSTDKTENTVKKMMEVTNCKLSYFKQEKKGPAAARNLGIKHSKGEVIGFLDDDIVVGNDWIMDGLSILSNEDADVIGGPAYFPQKLNKNLITDYLDISDNRKEIENNPYYLRTWNFFTKKTVFDEVGIFDEDFKLSGGEDVEWGQRAIFKKKKLLYTLKLAVYHFHPSSFADLIRRGFKYGTQEPKWINKTKFSRSNIFQVRRMLYRISWFLLPFMTIGSFLSYQLSHLLFYILFAATCIVFFRLGQKSGPVFIHFIQENGFLKGTTFIALHIFEEFVVGLGFFMGLLKGKLIMTE